MASSTIGVKLYVGTADPPTQAYDIKSYPDILGQPERIDVTTLTDTRRKYTPGVLASDSMQFVLNYDTNTFATLKDLEDETTVNFILALPDTHKFSFSGTLRVGFPGKGVNDAIEFNLNVEVASDVTYA